MWIPSVAYYLTSHLNLLSFSFLMELDTQNIVHGTKYVPTNWKLFLLLASWQTRQRGPKVIGEYSVWNFLQMLPRESVISCQGIEVVVEFMKNSVREAIIFGTCIKVPTFFPGCYLLFFSWFFFPFSRYVVKGISNVSNLKRNS